MSDFWDIDEIIKFRQDLERQKQEIFEGDVADMLANPLLYKNLIKARDDIRFLLSHATPDCRVAECFKRKGFGIKWLETIHQWVITTP